MSPAAVKLSRREAEVAQLIATGLSNRETAKRLGIGERTVEYHVEQILNKLGFHSRTQVAAWIADQRVSRSSIGDLRARTNLPIQLTSFVGRETDLEALHDMLARSRLVTLTGPGGVGKTRLALQLASGCLAQFPDGVWFVELAPLTEGGLISQALASSVGVVESPGHPLLDTLLDTIGQRQTLFLLDNCEHLVDVISNTVERLLKHCAKATVVTTSREPLKVPGEQLYPVAPLDIPREAGGQTAKSIAASPAIILFSERARGVDPAFALTDRNAVSVAEICRRLDGLPLAIELAAARLGVMRPEGLLANLDKRFQILSGGSRTAMPRQQALEATIDWSYRLLSEDEQSHFQRLSVFSGSFNVEAAEAVCGGEGLPDAILPILLRLVERSLVSPHPTDEDQPRYRLLETLRQYAAHRLQTGGSQFAIMRRHAAFFDALAAAAFRGTRTQQRAAWFARLEKDVDNLRAAFDWAITNDTDMALRMAANLELFWRSRYSLTEALSKTKAALEKGGHRSFPLALALSSAARLSALTGEFAAGRRFNDEALTMARQVAPASQLGFRVAHAGEVLVQLGDLESGESLLREGLELFSKTGDHEVDRYIHCLILTWLSWVAYLRQDFDSAIKYSNQGLMNIDGGRENTYLHSQICDTLGCVALDSGDLAGAQQYFETVLTIATDIHDLGMIGVGLYGLGNVAAARAMPIRALRLFGATEQVHRLRGIIWHPFAEQRVLSPWRRRARNAVESQVADQAWQEGLEMTVENAVAYALSGE